MTSHKETQSYNGLNTGQGSPSGEAVKIFLVSNMLFLGVAKAPVIFTIAAARWRNKIENTSCFPLKRLPRSHSYAPLASHWSTLSHMVTPNCKGSWGIWWAAQRTVPVQVGYLTSYERPLKSIVREYFLKVGILETRRKHLVWWFNLAYLATGSIQIVGPNFGWLHNGDAIIWKAQDLSMYVLVLGWSKHFFGIIWTEFLNITTL